MTIQIEKGIPLPEVRRRQPKNPYGEVMRQMEIGDSFACEGSKFNTLQGVIRAAAKKAGIAITVRREGKEGCKLRVWRVANTIVAKCGE